MDESDGGLQGNVAPIMSDDKAQFAIRQLTSTFLGGVSLSPGMTYKAFLFQIVLWLLVPAPGFLCAVAFSERSAVTRFVVAGSAATLLHFGVGLYRWTVCRAKHDRGVRRNLWFTDYDDVDYSVLLAPETCRVLLPPKRSWLHSVFCCVLTFALIGCAATVLDIASIETDLGLGSGHIFAWLLLVKCFLTVAAAQFGLTAKQPVEATKHRYCNTSTFSGLLADYSRPLLLLMLLGPTSLGLGSAGTWLRVTVALLSVLWAVAVVPQVDTLLPWAIEQCEVVLFGGSSLPADAQLLCKVLMSVSVIAVIAVMHEITKENHGVDTASVIVMAASPAMAVILAAIPPCLADIGCNMFRRLACGVLQAALGSAAAAGLVYGLGRDAVHQSLRQDRSFDVAWCARLALEQVSVGVCFVALHCVSARHLRVDSFCGRRHDHPKSANAVFRIQRAYVAFEILVRIALFAHVACYGSFAFENANGTHTLVALEAVALVRALRIASTDTPRAAGDAWVTGLLDIMLVATDSAQFPTEWSLGVRLLFVSEVRRRLAAFVSRVSFAAHLTKVGSRLPKLRHPLSRKLFFINLAFLPVLIFIMLCSAILESPLVALFTMPCFLIGYPRPRNCFPELPPDGCPVVKGVEGLFYQVLEPSLLRDLAARWRCHALEAQSGALLFCRSHERLACFIRILSAGLGWVSVEVRGLEMQEPTSCHHAEAGRIDDAFSAIFELKSGPAGGAHSAGAPLAAAPHSREGVEGPTGVANQPKLFVMNPVCQVRATTYEQTQLSMTGILDNSETLRQVHRLFLKTLVWVMAQHRAQHVVPRSWLSCPLKARDAQAVLNLLRTCSWSQRVAAVFGSQASFNNKQSESNSNGAAAGVWAGVPAAPYAWLDTGDQVQSRPSSRGHVDALPQQVSSPRASSPQPIEPIGTELPTPPPGPPPSALRLSNNSGPKAKAMALADGPEMMGTGSSNDSTRQSSVSHGTSQSSFHRNALPPLRSATTVSIFGVADVSPMQPEYLQPEYLQPDPPAFQAGPLLPSEPWETPRQNTRGEDDLDELMGMILDATPPQSANAKAKAAPLRRSPSCEEKRRTSTRNAPPIASLIAREEDQYDASAVAATRVRKSSKSVTRPSPATPKHQTVLANTDDLDCITKLVIQSYTAVNIAPTYGRSPETLGPSHILKVFLGKFADGTQAPEVLWMKDKPELLELTVRAFRHALKVTVDCVAMAEDASNLDDDALEAALRELDLDWHLGQEDSQQWQTAMERRKPHLMALRQKTLSEYQVLRLSLVEDDIRVGELRQEVVQSIWASESLELRYFTNDDEERYSIQAHPTLLRNMIVQSAEYPIFVSPPTTVWL